MKSFEIVFSYNFAVTIEFLCMVSINIVDHLAYCTGRPKWSCINGLHFVFTNYSNCTLRIPMCTTISTRSTTWTSFRCDSDSFDVFLCTYCFVSFLWRRFSKFSIHFLIVKMVAEYVSQQFVKPDVLIKQHIHDAKGFWLNVILHPT